MVWGIRNLSNEDEDSKGAYSVQHGHQPVQDFVSNDLNDQNKDNLFEKAFPCLFPYGQGGLEGNRLRALMSAHIQTSISMFEKDAHLFRQLSTASLIRAARCKDAHQADEEASIQVLKKHTQAVSSRLHSQIWSTSICKDPPSLWVTINPCDLHDLIVQILAGEDIGSSLSFLFSPNKDQRACNVARDPYAAAQFFHYLIRTTMEILFGISSSTSTISCTTGVAGKLLAYFGTVESQGRGSLLQFVA
ncbi:hypothetical protein OG21DRAFT_1479734 [Imleria badia]|nr:hypothetical protein OG21DRAFT_1479734 [Imleria badia]